MGEAPKEEESLIERYAEAIAELRGKKRGSGRRRRAVDWQIEQELASIEDLLKAKTDYALWKGYIEAAAALDEKEPFEHMPLLDQEIEKARAEIQTLEADIAKLEERHGPTLMRLRLLWKIREVSKPVPMVTAV